MKLHISVPVNDTMEYINATQISPLISKCNVKVCWVGPRPNRNGTVITKEFATELGRKLPGSPVVGYYNEQDEDFEGHNREIVMGKEFKIIDVTKPYGFVPTDAKVWFQTFHECGEDREYLVTECYLWTEAYPESKRVIDKGNNQSMELKQENEGGIWANDDKTGQRIFIYNDALIEKLCILGESVEPCFEGAQFFSLENSEQFQKVMFSMLTELQQIISKGGSCNFMEENKNLNPAPAPEDTFEKEKDEKDKDTKGNPAPEDKEDKDKEDKDKKDTNACNKKKYNLEDVVEYTELSGQYAELQTQFNNLQEANNALTAEVESLREFKAATELKDKQAMIDSFYMLTDEDKKDVVDNINTYSLEDIEAKLSIICVRNKVNFNNQENKEEPNAPTNFSLNNVLEDDAPDWIKAVRQNTQNV